MIKLGHHFQGLIHVPIKHDPTIGDFILRIFEVMFKIPKKGYISTPGFETFNLSKNSGEKQ